MNEDEENMKSAELDEEEEEDMDGSNSEKLQSGNLQLNFQLRFDILCVL